MPEKPIVDNQKSLKEALIALQSGKISLEDTKKELNRNKDTYDYKDSEKDIKRSNDDCCTSKNIVSKADIAIIGMSGQFPKAKNIEEYWQNLKQGKNCVSEVPDSRWNTSKYYDKDINVKNKTNCKWQGVLEDVDKFDPLFFNISPAEAEIIDPQHRLFLETSWACIEDAGINPSDLSKSRCGVFVGCGAGDYGELGEGKELNAHGLMGSSPSILSARISYLLNLKGPCLAIDTACSSALVAISEACNSLILDNCDIALAGGVHIMLSPDGFVMASKAGMLSSDGRCYTFDTRANGFVPGEGVGVVLLKRLWDAVRDKDPIYGVIKGWGVNQDGKTNGITAPSVNSQISIEKEVYKRFDINPQTITMVEAHGTGTKLGDPIEVEALIESFQSFTDRKNYCALGSVKSNIGHAIKAAGIAGVIKILLSIKHKMIPPTINFEKLNEHISVDESPFYINTKLTPWEAPTGLPRRACVSSFGFSGTNSHIVIEEYVSSDEEKTSSVSSMKKNQLFVLSARKKEQLKNYAKRIKSWVELQEQFSLEDMTYTLQIGREAMEHRLAFCVSSKEELLELLEDYIENKPNNALLTARVKKKSRVSDLEALGYSKQMIDKWIVNKDLDKLGELFIKGFKIEWQKLYDKRTVPSRINLPTYPFKRERYWLYDEKEYFEDEVKTIDASIIHPLLHEDTSNELECRYSSTFTGEESFFKAHVIKGRKTMPGVAYLEMARVAAEKIYKIPSTSKITLKNIVWIQAIVVENKPVSVNISFTKTKDYISFKIYNSSESTSTASKIYCQGRLVLNENTQDRTPALNLYDIKNKCNKKLVSSDECYSIFSQLGIEYGDDFRGIESINIGDELVLAKLVLPESSVNTKGDYGLHPCIIDSALQSSVALVMGTDNQRFALPFELKHMEIYSKSTSKMWAVIRYSKDYSNSTFSSTKKIRRLDIDICDEYGLVCTSIKGLTSKAPDTKNYNKKESTDTLLLYPTWQEQGGYKKAKLPNLYKHFVAFCEIEQYAGERIINKGQEIECLTLHSQDKSIDERLEEYSIKIFETIQKLLKHKHKEKILFQIVAPYEEDKLLLSALSALLKTAHKEHSKFVGQLIQVEKDESLDSIILKIKENIFNINNKEVRYKNGKRLVCKWNELDSLVNTKSPWRDSGVYLITGGAGGLGQIFSKEIAQKANNPVLILTGRSIFNGSKKKDIADLEMLGATVIYKQMNVANRQEVHNVISSIKAQYGNINGIIHCAGVIEDNYIVKKNKDEIKNVLAPKVTGVMNLDLESKNIKLDLVVLFSSGAGAMGNAGQLDYSIANSFMDKYAFYRNDLVMSEQRHGRTLSINWPLWKYGGLKVDEENEKMVRRSTGMVAMKTTKGLKAFYQCFSSSKEQVMVLEGNIQMLKDKIYRINDEESIQAFSNTLVNEERAFIDKDSLIEKVRNNLIKMVSNMLKVKVQDIELDDELSEYGFDSITLTQFVNKINEKYIIDLTPTIFFEYPTLQSFTMYLINEYEEALVSKHSVQKTFEGITKVNEIVVEKEIPVIDKQVEHKSLEKEICQKNTINANEPIAIVGISGIFPESKDIEEFWSNLEKGKDCITEIPKNRWDWREYYGDPSKEDNKTNVKWGGFIEAIDEFDPLFFGISPQEAKLMDPQQRIMMMYAWKTLEDAGYSAKSIAGSKTGIFVGTANTGYSELVCRANLPIEGYTATGLSISVGPNRISYFLDIHGPSEPIETACSSSLIAIHRAVSAIKDGSCDMALAGGVSTLVSPDAYIGFTKAGMLCEDGRCKTFSDKANGYVRGEGAGMVFLKRLKDAERDGDNIYGVVRGTAENHGGRANSLTAPNPKAQADVIKTAYNNAGIDPRTVTYIEAHGTGTELGDPVEINGLKMAFKDLYESTGDKEVTNKHCGLGSVKTNIGHLELSAGIAGIVKVLLQMKHKTLAKSLHSESINPYIKIEDSPFYIVNEKKEWEALKDNEGNVIPHRAGVSSFGFGGANCHIVLEEYIPECSNFDNSHSYNDSYIVVLSAKNKARLREQAQQLVDRISNNKLSQQQLINMAYTLQVGREAMEERIAIIVNNVEELKQKLKAFVEGKQDIDDLYKDKVKPNKEALTIFIDDDDIREAVGNWAMKKKYTKIAQLWTKGFDIDWELLYDDERPNRISLPTYPFAKEKYWVSASKKISRVKQAVTTEVQTSKVQEIPVQNPKVEVPKALAPKVEISKVNTPVESKPLNNPVKNIEAVKVRNFNNIKYVENIVKDVLGLPDDTRIEAGEQLSDYGMDSIAAIKLQERVKNDLKIELDGRRFVEKFTMDEVVNQIEEKKQALSSLNNLETKQVEEVIIKKEIKEESNIKEHKQQSKESVDAVKYVEAVAIDILGLSTDTIIETDEQLSDYGMDSIAAIKLQERVKSDLKIELDGRKFVEKFTIDEVVKQINELNGSEALVVDNVKETKKCDIKESTKNNKVNNNKTEQEYSNNSDKKECPYEKMKKSERAIESVNSNGVLAWERDKQLPKEILIGDNAIPFRHKFEKEKVFLTGVTGLIGTFLCGEMLKSTSSNIFCLIRSQSKTEALERIKESLSKYHLWSEGYRNRIIPILGDLNEEKLGIDKDIYEELSKDMEAIYHCGAFVNHVMNYPSMKKANVDGTISVIEFAANKRTKPIHFVSSIGVCIKTGDDNLLLPPHTSETLLADGRYLTNGYSQTKWVSEHHIMEASKKGIPVTIMRCGQVTGTSDSSIGITGDMIHRFLKIFSEIDYVPTWSEGVIDITPIDYISQAILAISQQNDCYGKIYNLVNPKPIEIREYFGYLKKRNPNINEIPYEQWVDYCEQYIESLPDSNNRTVLLDFYIKRGSGYRLFEVYYFRYQGLENSNTTRALEDTGVEFPTINQKWWDKCLIQLENI